MYQALSIELTAPRLASCPDRPGVVSDDSYLVNIVDHRLVGESGRTVTFPHKEEPQDGSSDGDSDDRTTDCDSNGSFLLNAG